MKHSSILFVVQNLRGCEPHSLRARWPHLSESVRNDSRILKIQASVYGCLKRLPHSPWDRSPECWLNQRQPTLAPHSMHGQGGLASAPACPRLSPQLRTSAEANVRSPESPWPLSLGPRCRSAHSASSYTIALPPSTQSPCREPPSPMLRALFGADPTPVPECTHDVITHPHHNNSGGLRSWQSQLL